MKRAKITTKSGHTFVFEYEGDLAEIGARFLIDARNNLRNYSACNNNALINRKAQGVAANAGYS